MPQHFDKPHNGELLHCKPGSEPFGLHFLAADADKIKTFTANMYSSMCEAMADGKGTRDLSGPSGLTTEQFVAEVAKRLGVKMNAANPGGKIAAAS